MAIDPKIFKAYDIRGVYPTEVNEDVAYQIGRAFVAFTQAAKVIVGRDARVSGPELFQALTRGITDQGADVLDIGVASTDMFYFACGSTALPGVTVTASHNPKEYNGFKLVKKMPELLSGEKIRDVVLAGNFPESAKKGGITPLDIKAGFKEKILSLIDVKKLKSRKIVIDPANG
ncbi:MAG: phosphomannomutase/phosphoglucomutase, partial [Candidatus Komeilibacteria bacterium]|nr:phosphomannomutase/phosphoglucomutase [Candidatus Komeilibacteria bacterium]